MDFLFIKFIHTKAKATLCDCIMTSRGDNATFVWLCGIPSLFPPLLVNCVLVFFLEGVHMG